MFQTTISMERKFWESSQTRQSFMTRIVRLCSLFGFSLHQEAALHVYVRKESEIIEQM